MDACQVSETYADVAAVIVELIDLDLVSIFRCPVISKKGLSCVFMALEMGTNLISLRGLMSLLDTISKARVKILNLLTSNGTTSY